MQGRQIPPSSPRTDVPESLRLQILATEHVIVVLFVYATKRIIERGRRSLEPRFAR